MSAAKETSEVPDHKLRSIDRWQVFAENVLDYAFILLDLDRRVVEWSPGAVKLLGYAAEEIVGRSGDLIFTPEDRKAKAPVQEATTALAQGTAEDERWHLRKDGSRFRASGVLTAIRDGSNEVLGFAKVMRDVTAREQARDELERSLRERTALEREVHHRVKNNLQLVLSLVRLQADRMVDGPSQAAFQDTEARVRAIAAVHERVYASPDFATIHVDPYLRALIRDVQSLYDSSNRVSVRLTSIDLVLEIEQAMPLALLVTELFSNALKHAFPDGRRGTVELKVTYGASEVQREGSSTVRVEVRDDGAGLAPGVDWKDSNSMGFELIRILTDQLGAELIADTSSGGTAFAFSFSVPDA